MEQGAQVVSELLINHLDKNARDNVIKLDQKLKGLRAEVEVRLQYPSLNQEEGLQDYLEKLTLVTEEIDSILGGLDVLIQMSADNPQMLDAFVQTEEMQEFNQLISEYLEKVTSLQKEF